MVKNNLWHRHFGIYGVCFNEYNELLVVKKNDGPYKGRYDLPGGSQKPDESLIETLHREFMEETGMKIQVINNLGCFDYLVNSPYNGCKYTQHIAQYYSVKIVSESVEIVSKYITNCNEIEENDSNGYVWVKLDLLNVENSSPLVIDIINFKKNNFDFAIKRYMDWNSNI